MKKVASQSDRLHELMRAFDISQSDLANKAGLSRSSISMCLSDKRNMGSRIVEKIAQAFGVYVEWLMGYDCPMTKTEALECVLETEKITDDRLRRLLFMYSRLNERDREIVDNLIDGMSKHEN